MKYFEIKENEFINLEKIYKMRFYDKYEYYKNGLDYMLDSKGEIIREYIHTIVEISYNFDNDGHVDYVDELSKEKTNELKEILRDNK